MSERYELGEPTPETMPVYRQVIEEAHRRTLDKVFHILAHQRTPADQETPDE